MVEAAIGGVQRGFEPVGRLVDDILHQTAGGVAAKQRALRPFEHFDALQVEGAKGLALHVGDIAIVNIDRDRRLDGIVEIVLRHAADRELAVLATDIARQRDTGRQPRDVDRGLHVERLELGPAKSGDGNAHILTRLRAALGRHHDIAGHRALGGCCHRLGRQRCGQYRQRQAGQQTDLGHPHMQSPRFPRDDARDCDPRGRWDYPVLPPPCDMRPSRLVEGRMLAGGPAVKARSIEDSHITR